MSYRPDGPDRFGSLERARTHYKPPLLPPMATAASSRIWARTWAPCGQLLMTEDGSTVLASSFAYGSRDAAPDAWGRWVIEAKLKVPANSLPESQYLLHAGSDCVGALDIRGSRHDADCSGAWLSGQRRMQVSHLKLCASRGFWLVAYPSQGDEMCAD